MKKIFSILALALYLQACGGGTTSDNNDDFDPDGDLVNAGQKVTLNYEFSSQLASASTTDSASGTFQFPDEYQVPMYIKSNGEITMRAKDFPKMVIRICPTGSSRSDCDARITSDEDIGQGVDLVFDVCSFTEHNFCGDSDNTQFKGSLVSSGRMVINALPVRIRVFMLGKGPDGFTADTTDSGFVPDLPRLSITLQTDPEINTGKLKITGKRVVGNQVELATGSVMPASMPEMAGSHYVGRIKGSFNVNPLTLLED